MGNVIDFDFNDNKMAIITRDRKCITVYIDDNQNIDFNVISDKSVIQSRVNDKYFLILFDDGSIRII